MPKQTENGNGKFFQIPTTALSVLTGVFFTTLICSTAPPTWSARKLPWRLSGSACSTWLGIPLTHRSAKWSSCNLTTQFVQFLKILPFLTSNCHAISSGKSQCALAELTEKMKLLSKSSLGGPSFQVYWQWVNLFCKLFFGWIYNPIALHARWICQQQHWS